jgi:hypothetical protein
LVLQRPCKKLGQFKKNDLELRQFKKMILNYDNSKKNDFFTFDSLAGTTEVLSVLFFDFISLVTFLSPVVTPSPLFKAAKMFDISGVALAAGAINSTAGGGGGPGGGGADESEEAEAAATDEAVASSPRGFHVTPVV